MQVHRRDSSLQRVFWAISLGSALACAFFLWQGLIGSASLLVNSANAYWPVSLNQDRVPLPDDALDGGVAWINTGTPIHLGDLKGKIVLLDFWTYCCINCHHVLPDLEKLERKYGNELVVIGVHTAKFDAEKKTENIRQKVAEYRIRHPVINDANQVLWRKFGVNSWPTLAVIDARGRFVGAVSGEGHYDTLDKVIGQLVADHRQKGELNTAPLLFTPEMDQRPDSPLLYPGKVLADAASNRLFVSDTGHNRIVITDLEGKSIATVGSGATALADGSYTEAAFNRPQGMCLVGQILYVADTENHAIRAIDLASERVTTIAGNGQQSYRRTGGGLGKETGLNSPWDIVADPRNAQFLYVAMAGPHQIWTLDTGSGQVRVWAGSGVENIIDGTRAKAAFAQPSGLAVIGDYLFVADSEVSGIRAISLDQDRVATIVGVGLFGFGDRDGQGNDVRLQHCLGLAVDGKKLYIADSYNNKIKVCEPAIRSVKTLLGMRAGGFGDDPPLFDEPGGLSVANGNLYVADTNNHAIRVIDLASQKVRTLALDGVTAAEPPESESQGEFANAREMKLQPAKVRAGDSVSLAITLELPEGYKVNPDAPMPYRIAADGKELSLVDPTKGQIAPPADRFTIQASLERPAKEGETMDIKVSLSAFLCTASICEIHSYELTLPIEFTADGEPTVSASIAAKP